MARLIVVDDTSDLISYTSGPGTWSATDGTEYDNAGNFGMPYMNTLHKGTGEVSFTFKFNGTDGQVFGTVDMDYKNNDPSWECLLDGLQVRASGFQYVENNWPLCQWTTTTNVEHTLVVNVHSKSRPFLLDYINYVPDPAIQLVDKSPVVLFQHTDPQIQYASNKWDVFANISHINTQNSNDSLATIDFYGSRLKWYSIVPAEMPQNTLIAAWAIDGEAAVNFTVTGQPAKKNRTTRYNELYFQTPSLPLASHTLQVRTYPSPGTVPFILAYLVVEQGKAVAPLNASASSSTPSFSSSLPVSSGPVVPIRSSSGMDNTPASTYHVIIGVSVGLFSCFVFAIAILYIRRRRPPQSPSETSSDSFGAGSILPSKRGPYLPLNNEPSVDLRNMSVESRTHPESLETRVTSFCLSELTLVTPQPSSNHTQRHAYANHRPSSSTSTGANSLFPTSRLAPLPEKADSFASPSPSPVGIRGARYRPYQNSLFSIGSHSRTSSSTTLLQSESNIPPSKLPPPVSLPLIPNLNNQNTRPTVIIHHDDSGIRMPQPLDQNESILVDRPPTYTPG